MKIALVPVNTIVGDFSGNLKIHLEQIDKARSLGAGLVVFPELSLIGYPCLDYLHRPSFAEEAKDQLETLKKSLKKDSPAVIVGTVLDSAALERDPKASPPSVRTLVNAAVFLAPGREEVRIKTLIPFYDVFTESRYFESAVYFHEKYRRLIDWEGEKLGILICEDSWHEMELNGARVHRENPTERLAKQGCSLAVNISASPYDTTKRDSRRTVISKAAKAHGLRIAYMNHFGAQDGIVFDGDAFFVNEKGEVLAEKQSLGAESLVVDGKSAAAPKYTKLKNQKLADLKAALVTGIRDYARKNGFERAVLGLSGGIDSAVVAVLAAEALGAKNVTGLAMPSKYSSTGSIDDAESLARVLGLSFKHFPIKMAHSTHSLALKPFFEGLPEDVTEENLQSRLRGVSVMAFSNKFRSLALATGNKSEFAVGYATLYGDMCGGLAPIGDVYKTTVYELARFLNEERLVIPESTLTKAPSAELRPGQTDQDSLPPYDLLDRILYGLIEEEKRISELYQELKGDFPKLDESLVREIQRKLMQSEFKRYQAPPILRVSRKAFGIGRQYPLTGRF